MRHPYLSMQSSCVCGMTALRQLIGATCFLQELLERLRLQRSFVPTLSRCFPCAGDFGNAFPASGAQLADLLPKVAEAALMDELPLENADGH